MPIYEYACKICGTRFEKLQPVTAEPIKVCPNCGQESVRRVIHPAGIIFKGSGWYKTDSRKPPPSEGTSDGSSASEKPSESKSTEGNEGGKSSESSESSETKSTSAPSEKSSSTKDSGSASKQ